MTLIVTGAAGFIGNNSALPPSLMMSYFQAQEIDMRETRTLYEQDIIAWANEQAKFIRSGQFNLLDREHIADEIEDVGKSERRELANRMTVLLALLLKWQFQPGRRGAGWQRTIKEQRRAIALHIQDTPSLRACLVNAHWLEAAWADAVAKATDETGLEQFPELCPWTQEQILSQAFYPDRKCA
jgi:hypothetical protein